MLKSHDALRFLNQAHHESNQFPQFLPIPTQRSLEQRVREAPASLYQAPKRSLPEVDWPFNLQGNFLVGHCNNDPLV